MQRVLLVASVLVASSGAAVGAALNSSAGTVGNEPSLCGDGKYKDWVEPACEPHPADCVTTGTPCQYNDPLIGNPNVASHDVDSETFEAGFDLYATVLSVVALVGFFNPKKFHIPDAVTLALTGLMVSVILIVVDRFILPKEEGDVTGQITEFCRNELIKSQFSELMLNYFLGFLFFANAIECDVPSLASKWRFVLALSVVGVVISTIIIGGGVFLVFFAVGLRQQWQAHLLRCFLFGAIITPTDAHKFLITFLEKAGAPPTLLAKIVGEALFNDGAVVIIFTVVKLLIDGETVDGLSVQVLLLTEVVGGLLIGGAFGFIVARAMRLVKARRSLCVLLSIVIVFDLVVICHQVHASAPLACAAAGLVVGAVGMPYIDPETKHDVHAVWNFIDESMQGSLFLLMGFFIITIDVTTATIGIYIAACISAIVISLIARFISVWFPLQLVKRGGRCCCLESSGLVEDGAVRVLTWGGMRGGASIALALSLTPYEGQSVIFAMSYAVVFFSIVVQGLTLPRVLRCILILDAHSNAEADALASLEGGGGDRDDEYDLVSRVEAADAGSGSGMGAPLLQGGSRADSTNVGGGGFGGGYDMHVHMQPGVDGKPLASTAIASDVPGPTGSGPLGLFSQPGGGYHAAASTGYGSMAPSPMMQGGGGGGGGSAAGRRSVSGAGGHHGHNTVQTDPVLRRSEAAARRMFTAKWGSDGRAQSLVSGAATPPGAGAGTPMRSGQITPVHGAVDFAQWRWQQQQQQQQQFQHWQAQQQWQQQQQQQQQFQHWQQVQLQQRGSNMAAAAASSSGGSGGGGGGAPTAGGDEANALASRGGGSSESGGGPPSPIPVATAVSGGDGVVMPASAAGAEGEDFQAYLSRLSSTQQPAGGGGGMSALQADAALSAISESTVPPGSYSVIPAGGASSRMGGGGRSMGMGVVRVTSPNASPRASQRSSPISTPQISPIATPVQSDDEDEEE